MGKWFVNASGHEKNRSRVSAAVIIYDL